MITLTNWVLPTELGNGKSNRVRSRKTIIPWAKHKVQRFDFGEMLLQSESQDNFVFYSNNADFSETSTLNIQFHEPVNILFFLLEGAISLKRANLASHNYETGQWGMLYFPEGFSEIEVSKGGFRLVMFIVKGHYINDLQDSDDLFREFASKQGNHPDKPMQLPTAYIDHNASNTLKIILSMNVKRAELAMEIKPLLSFLLNHYRKTLKESPDAGQLPDVPFKEIISDLIKQINADPSKPFSLRTSARKHGVNYRVLVSSFREITKTTLKSYIHEQRMQLAYHLVTTTQYPFIEVAEALGYIEINNLHRAFMKRYGITMLEARQQKSNRR